jgi:hypothetical protein
VTAGVNVYFGRRRLFGVLDAFAAVDFNTASAFLAEDLRASAYEQSRGQSSVRESSGSVDVTRGELLRRLDAIYQTAHVTAFIRPELEDKFRSPRGINDQALLTLARTYGNDAFPLKAEFVKRGLGADFINELAEAAQGFEAALNERTQGRGKHVAATAGIDRLIDCGLQIVRVLRVLVLNAYAADPAKLALWESASHVEKPSHRTRNHGDGNQPPPPAQN